MERNGFNLPDIKRKRGRQTFCSSLSEGGSGAEGRGGTGWQVKETGRNFLRIHSRSKLSASILQRRMRKKKKKIL